MLPRDKPKLSIQEQVDYLKNKKGVAFDKMTEDEALDYLAFNNNYFKLTAYRKNFEKYQNGPNKDKYIDLDFSYLVDFAVIDMRLRNIVLEMSLNVEHFAKVKLMNIISQSTEDGYQLVTDYENCLSATKKDQLDAEIDRNSRSIYCEGIINKYKGCFPVWAFVEIITLNQFLAFYKFCADRFSDNGLKKDHELMQYYIRPLRNAAAHSNCIINDIRAGYDTHRIDPLISKAVGKIPGMSKTIRRSKFANPRIRQIVTLLFVHKNMASPGVNNHISESLKEFRGRMYKYHDYSTNQIISTSFKFLADIIDNWY